jgi:hypothetical protein
MNGRFLALSGAACSVVLTLGLAAEAWAQKSAPSALDFVPVVQGGEDEVQDSASVKVDEKENVVAAATVQDAINAAVDANQAEIKENLSTVKKAAEKNEVPAVGAHKIEVNGQIGFVATGAAAYTVSENIILSRISQRQAYVRAFQMAKKNLARELFGLSNEGKDEVREQIASINTSLDNLNNLSSSTQSTINQSLDEMLRGFVIYEVYDDTESSMIYVSVVSTPKTRGQLARKAPHHVESATLVAAIQQVVEEIRQGLVPPVGGRIIEVPQTGETAFVGFGSSVVGLDKLPALQARLNLDATRKADAYAIDALCGLIIGDQISWQLGVRDSLREEVKRYEDIVEKDPTAEKQEEFKKLEEERKEHIARSQTTEVFQSARKGKIPPGVTVKNWMDDDNAWAYAIAVYIPSVTNASATAGKEMRNAKILQDINDSTSPAGGKAAGDAAAPTGKAKQPTEKLKKGVTGKVDKKDL